MENEKIETIPDNCEITISPSVQDATRIYGNIDMKPANAKDNIDYFELYINDVAQGTVILSNDDHFSADLRSSYNKWNFQIHLPPGKYKCYLKGIPKEKHQEAHKSNVIVCR